MTIIGGLDMLAMRPLSSTFVVEISGMDLGEPLPPASLTMIVGALFRHHVVVLPRQSLSIGEFERFGRYFGEPLPDGASPRIATHPAVRPLVHRCDGAGWVPRWQALAADAAVTAVVLYADQPPDPEAGLLVADLVAAYETLPEEMQARLEALSFRHVDGRTEPLVRRHRLTGQRSLAPVAAAHGAIVGLPPAAAAELLDELREHCLRPAFIYRHQCLLGDVFAWDPVSTMYATSWAELAGAGAAALYRLDVQGMPAVLPDCEADKAG